MSCCPASPLSSAECWSGPLLVHGTPDAYSKRRLRAARKCSNQTDLRLTLVDLFYGSNLPERLSPTSVRLVCIQVLSLVRVRASGLSSVRACERIRAELSRIGPRRLRLASWRPTGLGPPGGVRGVLPRDVLYRLPAVTDLSWYRSQCVSGARDVRRASYPGHGGRCLRVLNGRRTRLSGGEAHEARING